MDPSPPPSEPPDPARPLPAADLHRARVVARVLDDLVPIPGTSWRVGLDPVLGLVPGVGDWVGWAASLHLLGTAVRIGADSATLVRMAANVLLDAIAGAVPLLGDAFDLAWKANHRNLRLLERIATDPHGVRRASRMVVVGVLGGTFTLLVAASVGAFFMFKAVVGALLGLL